MHALERPHVHPAARATARATPRPTARPVPRLGVGAAFLLATLALPAQAIVHDRLPGDDAGGSSTLPVPAGHERAAAARTGTGTRTGTRTGTPAGERVVERSE